MVKNIPASQLQSGDAVYVKGARMTITNVSDEITGVTMSLIDDTGHGHWANYGLDDIVPLDLSD
jgi:hypothetical protein